MESSYLPKVLLVDDDASIRALVRRIVARDYELLEAETGEEALELFQLHRPSIVLLDIVLPGIDGYEVCRQIKRLPASNCVNVIMVSSKSSRGEQLAGYTAGADDYVVKPFDPYELASRIRLHFRLQDALGEASSIAERLQSNQQMIDRIAQDRMHELLATQDVTVFALAKVAESRDNETGKHLMRIRAYAQEVALALADAGPYTESITQHFLTDLYRSSPLHDIGKVGIPDSILLKPGPLTREEFKVMKTHTTIGYDILEEAVANCDGGGFLAMAVEIARSHHERWDGLGYPDGLLGQQIPLSARIVSVVDVFDALTSTRPYKEPFAPERAKRIILDGSGTQFDPDVVQAFLKSFEQLKQIGKKLHDHDTALFQNATFLHQDFSASTPVTS